MMKQLTRYLLGLLLVLVLACCSGSLPPETRYVQNPNNVTHMMNSTVDLVHRNRQGAWRSHCTGFFVSTDIIITASHCVNTRIFFSLGVFETVPFIGAEAYFIAYEQWDDVHHQASALERIQPRVARVLGFDRDLDVAVLGLASGTVRSAYWFSLTTNIPNIGDQVYVIGNPGTNNWILTQGLVSQLRTNSQGNLTEIDSTAQIWYGTSGGPLVNNFGQVLGIAVGISNDQNYLGVHMPTRHIQTVLRSIDHN